MRESSFGCRRISCYGGGRENFQTINHSCMNHPNFSRIIMIKNFRPPHPPAYFGWEAKDHPMNDQNPIQMYEDHGR